MGEPRFVRMALKKTSSHRFPRRLDPSAFGLSGSSSRIVLRNSDIVVGLRAAGPLGGQQWWDAAGNY
jgi:hypothetical protein